MIALLAALAIGGGPPVPGDRIEAFALADQKGRIVSWEPKRTTVLTFCAFWCDTWKDQLPRVRQAQSACKGLPVDFYTVSVDGRWSEVSQSAAAGELLLDKGSSWCGKLGIDRVPYVLVLDRLGKVAWATTGVIRFQDLVDHVKSANNSTNGGDVYLTFDDFPSGKSDHDLLDVLRAESAPATFFCIGENIADRRAIVARAVSEGHSLQVHAWSHAGPKFDPVKCSELLKSLGGNGEWVRLPGRESITDLKGRVISLRAVDPYDYKRPGAAELTRRILYAVRPGCVIQLHAGVDDTIEALPGIIGKLRGEGYKLRLLPERNP